MFLVALLFAFALALILTGLFYFILGLRGPWKGSWVFFIIIFLISLAAGEWIVPIGPMAWGYYWLPALTAAVLIAILLAAAAPPKGNVKPPKSGKETRDDVQKELTSTSYYSPHAGEPAPLYSGDEPPEGVAIGALLWFFIILLLIAAIIGVLY